MEKLRNEITRTPALKALAAVATSPLQIDLSTWFVCWCFYNIYKICVHV